MLSVDTEAPAAATADGGASSDVRFVPLKGYLVPAAAWQLFFALMNRGVEIHVDGDDLVLDGPTETVTPAEDVAIRRWKRHLIALAEYRAPDDPCGR